MATLLRIDSSPMAGDSSFSRQLTTEFVRQWQETHPGGKVITRDLAATNLSQVTAQWIGAAYTPEAALNQQQREILAISDELISELYQADEYVFGVPMHNFSIPSSLKLWIDQIVRAGKTFAYENGASKGLLSHKRATFLMATGGDYKPGTPMQELNFVEPYLRSLFGFIGVTDTRFVTAGGTARRRFGVEPGVILQPALDAVRAHFQAA